MTFQPEISAIQERVDHLIASKLSPLDLLPSTFGLEWGMSKDECSKILGKKARHHKMDYDPSIKIRKGEYLAQFVFNGDYEALNRMYYRLFWNSSSVNSKQEETTQQKIELAKRDYRNVLHLIEHYSTFLGKPDTFTKSLFDPDFTNLEHLHIDLSWKINNSILTFEYRFYRTWNFLLLKLQPETVICQFESFDKADLLPTDILPSKLGISWDSSKEEVLRTIKAEVLALPDYINSWYKEVMIEVRGQKYKLGLTFDYSEKFLKRIKANLYKSRSFWDGEWTYEEMFEIGRRVDQRYRLYLKKCRKHLGNPFYRDGETYIQTSEEDFPSQSAIWPHSEARMELEIDKEDKELPYVISVACYPKTEDLDPIMPIAK